MKYLNFILGVLVVLLLVKVIKDMLTKREGFSYSDCMSQGYTKEFCVQRPLPGLCQCPNGLIGRIEPGFGGACVCSYYTPPMYPIPTIF